MKLGAIFRFELAYQARRPWPWLIFAVLVVVSFLMTRDGTLSEALFDEFFVNSPFAVAKTTVVGGLLWTLIAATVAGEAGARDVATRMHPLAYTTPVSKTEYLGGRFLAAFALNVVLLLAVQLGILLAVYLPGVDAELIGPFRAAAYVNAYAFLALPNAFVATAVQFGLAVRSGRPTAGYLGSLLLIFMGFFVASLLLFKQEWGKLLDPIGVRFVLDDFSHLWTTTEKSWRLVQLEGTVLANRLIWTGVGIVSLAFTWWRFRFAHRNERVTLLQRLASRMARRAAAPAATAMDERTTAPIAVPDVARSFGVGTSAQQILALGFASFRSIASSWAGVAMFVALPLLTVPVVIDQMMLDGVPLIPSTLEVLKELTAPLSAELSRWVIVPLLIVFFAGELVWRERDAGLGEITDATPASDWVPFLGKFVGLTLVLIAFLTLLAAAGVLAQTILGHRDYEIGLYLRVLLGLQLPEYLLFALLALVVHGLVDQKYIGHIVAILAYALIVLAPMFGLDHNLLIFGAGPAWSYTELRGFAASLAPWAWFKLYWGAWCVLLAVVARVLWVRGRESGVALRMRMARRRFTRPTIITAAAAAVLTIALGGYVFYNTNVLNRYRSAAQLAERSAEYERRYGKYAGVAQPMLIATSLRVDIQPAQRALTIHGTYRLVNRSAVAIDSVHVVSASAVETRAMTFDRSATQVLNDAAFGHRIYLLDTHLQPGDSLQLDFEVNTAPHGFREDGVNDAVVANGTSFTNALLPSIGYQASRELFSAGDRRTHGLPARPLIRSLYDAQARKERREPIVLDAVVSTDDGQVAVAPGALRRSWSDAGRQYFHYSTDAPIGNEYAIYSANYAVREVQWTDPANSARTVTIRIFHNPKHRAHLDRTVRSVRASLDYYTKHFGAYPYGHLSIVERPPSGTGMHADASLISHGEGFPLWNPRSGAGSLDLPFAVVAHEMGHQWTVPYAAVEGAPVMSESLAWYYAMKVVEQTSGREQLRRLLKFMRQPNPIAPIRRGEPLLRGLDPYMSYRKGPFALNALSEYIGEERVNTALRRLVEVHRREDAPLATTLDLYRELKAVTPDSLHLLLHDLFEVNTYWQLKTESVRADSMPTGEWQVTLDVRARKVVFDSAGTETEVPMDEWLEIGIFAYAEQGGELSAPLHLQKYRIRSGAQTIRVTVPRKPALAGIDPHHVLDVEEREDDDNVRRVRLGASEARRGN